VTTTSPATSGGSFGVVAAFGMLVGAAVLGYGLLLLPASVLGGGWIAAIGASLLFSALFATEWSGERFGLSARDRRTLSLSFAGLAAVLVVAFVVVNYASYEAAEASSDG
jgi:hypothetical protein